MLIPGQDRTPTGSVLTFWPNPDIVVVSQAVSLDSLPPSCLPRNKQVIEATLELIHDRTPDLPTDLLAATRDLSRRGGLEPPDVQAQQFRDRLEQGTATEEDLAQLYFIL